MTDHTIVNKTGALDTALPIDCEAQAAAACAANKTAVFAALARASMTQVRVRFDGYGGDAQIEAIEAMADGRTAELPEGEIQISQVRWYLVRRPAMMSLRAAIEELAYACLDQVEVGWHNEEGAFGDFVFDVAAGTIALVFNARFTDVHTSQHGF